MTRTTYMQRIIDESWKEVMMAYLNFGSMDMAWREVIAGRLSLDFKNDVSEAEVILQSTDYNYQEAAQLVISSAIVMQECFDIEYQYQQYLLRVDLREADMHEQQKKQLRETFFAAFGVFMTLLMNQIQNLSDKNAEKALQSMLFQVGNFFTKRAGQLN